MNPIRIVLSCLAIPCAALVAQAPELRATPYILRGDAVDFVLFAQPGAYAVLLFSDDGGPTPYLGETWYLGLGAGLGVLDAGPVGSGGFRTTRITSTATAPLGVPLYFQGVAIDLSQPVPLHATDGESCVVGASRLALIEDYLDPAATGLTGNFDHAVRGRVQAAPARIRTHDVPPVGGTVFGQAIYGPLNPSGVRTMSVYRAADLGSTGEPELLTAIRWRAELPVSFDVFHNVAIDVAHSQVVPDYSIDPFTALPRFPASGLVQTFAQNVSTGEIPVRVFQGDYVIDPVNRRPDGYVPFPAMRWFAWNGVDSLLLDFRTPPDAAAAGTNGLRAYLMVQSTAQPNARVLSFGRFGNLVDPYAATVAQTGDCAYYDLQFEFLRLESTAISRWLQASIAQPDWRTPLVSRSQPPASLIAIEYRGARDALGQTATAWSANVDVADGLPFLQYRILFTTTLGAPTLPSVDQLVIPYQ